MKNLLLVVSFVALALAGNPCIFAEQNASRWENINIARKQLGGPPSEFSSYTLPSLASMAQTSIGASYFIELTPSTGGLYSWSELIAVDSEDTLTISVLSPIEKSLTVTISPPSGEMRDIVEASSAQVTDDFGIDGAVFESVTYVFDTPVSGMWKIVITATEAAMSKLPESVSATAPQGLLMVANYGPYAILGTPTQIEDYVGGKIGMTVQLIQSNGSALKTTALDLTGFQVTAQLDIIQPDGTEIYVPMNDGGLEGDLQANDGIYTAEITAPESGYYRTQILVNGVDPAGKYFTRTVDTLLYSVPDNVDFTGLAWGAIDTKHEVFQIYTGISYTAYEGEANPEDFKIYAEVWGTDASGKSVPISWAGGLQSIEQYNGNSVIRFDVDMQWINKAGASAPYQIKNARIQDLESSDPIDTADSISVTITSDPAEYKLSTVVALDEITDKMRFGTPPAKIADNIAKAKNGTQLYGKLLLVHGYCASGNPWPSTEFSESLSFDGGLCQSLTNDEFAQRMQAFADENGLEGCSAIGHSQGGLASAHLLNYYWSCFDAAIPLPGRPIQSVGSPYKGSSLAGTIADLGSIFGVGCGSNTDMTTTGGVTWQAGISAATRAEVAYYITRYSVGWFEYCSLPANMVLAWPNDGTTEQERADLDGALYCGESPDWCHTADMTDPPQYTDASRNIDMSNLSTW